MGFGIWSQFKYFVSCLYIQVQQTSYVISLLQQSSCKLSIVRVLKIEEDGDNLPALYRPRVRMPHRKNLPAVVCMYFIYVFIFIRRGINQGESVITYLLVWLCRVCIDNDTCKDCTLVKVRLYVFDKQLNIKHCCHVSYLFTMFESSQLLFNKIISYYQLLVYLVGR